MLILNCSLESLGARSHQRCWRRWRWVLRAIRSAAKANTASPNATQTYSAPQEWTNVGGDAGGGGEVSCITVATQWWHQFGPHVTRNVTITFFDVSVNRPLLFYWPTAVFWVNLLTSCVKTRKYAHIWCRSEQLKIFFFVTSPSLSLTHARLSLSFISRVRKKTPWTDALRWLWQCSIFCRCCTRDSESECVWVSNAYCAIFFFISESLERNGEQLYLRVEKSVIVYVVLVLF